MENMKRAISAFMALVLVLGMLPGVPMFAAAEEVETQPETVAVETTEAVTVPAETEAPETTAASAETVPETTAAVETVPETTAAQETVPEETVPETTESEETVPVETTEQVEVSAEAVDGEILEEKLVEEIAVSASKERTYVGDKVKLTATITPSDAENPRVYWEILEGDAYVTESGMLIANSAGIVRLVAYSEDGNCCSYDPESEDPDAGILEVEFVDYWMEINLKPLEEKNLLDDKVRVQIGETVALSVHYWTRDGEGNEKVELPLTTPDVKWSLEEGDERYADLLVTSGDCKEVTIRPKNVTEAKYLTLYAEDSVAGKARPVTVVVYSQPYKVGIYNDSDGGKEVTNDRIVINLRDYSQDDEIVLDLSASVLPLEALEPMIWECSDSFVEVEHDLDADEEPITTYARVYVDNWEGESTITITSKNHPDVSSKVIIKRARLLAQEDIKFSAATLRVTELIAGQSADLVALHAGDNEILDSTVVRWSLSPEDQAYATIDENGKLTAIKGIAAGKVITVLCSVIDNEDNAYLELPVTIRPLATYVEILRGELYDDYGPKMIDSEVLNDLTVPVDTANGRRPFRLGFRVYPLDDDDCGAKQEVKWSSSDPSIAAVDPDTDQIVWKGKNGTVTITATTTDGTNKKASVKLQFGVLVREMTIEMASGFYLRSGNSWTFDVNFYPSNATNTDLTWALVGENDSKYASVASNGRLTAKTVYEKHYVTLRATSKDGSGTFTEVMVPIVPKQDGILTIKGYGPYVTTEDNYVTKTTQTMEVYDSIDLEAYILGSDELEPVIWKSSNNKTAEVLDYGDGTATVTMLRTGSATITAISLNDGSKKATVTLKGVRMTSYIEITQKDELTALASGKSLVLKAKAYDFEDKTPTVSKLTWAIAEGGEDYATVTSGGKVTAVENYVGYPVTVTVVVSATDGSGVQEYYDIDIHPIAQGLQIHLDGSETTHTSYTYPMQTPGEETLQLEATVYPLNALQDVKWTSSNKSVASVDEYGEITCNKAGTVTITATAKDGSNRKATFKLTVVQIASYIYFEDYGVIAGGKNLTMKPVVLDGNWEQIKGKKLEWSLEDYPYDEEDGTAYATLTSGGVLKTKAVTAPKLVKVTVRTQEKNEDWEYGCSVVVGIYPATTSVEITDSQGKVIVNTVWGGIGEVVELGAIAKSSNGGEPFQNWIWTSSNPKIAEVNPYTGEVHCLKAGTVTITAKAVDGTNKTDKIKIKIW